MVLSPPRSGCSRCAWRASSPGRRTSGWARCSWLLSVTLASPTRCSAAGAARPRRRAGRPARSGAAARAGGRGRRRGGDPRRAARRAARARACGASSSRLARWPRGARRLPHRADQRHPRRPAARPPLRAGAHRARERARARPRRGDRRPRRRRRRAAARRGRALRRPARAARRLLRDREPRLVLGRRRLGGRRRARSASARCATSASRSAGDGGFDLAGVDDHRGDWVHGSPSDLGARSRDATRRARSCCSRTIRRPSPRRRSRASTSSSRATPTAGRSGRSATWCASPCRGSRACTARHEPALREPRHGLLGPAAAPARPRRDHRDSSSDGGGPGSGLAETSSRAGARVIDNQARPLCRSDLMRANFGGRFSRKELHALREVRALEALGASAGSTRRAPARARVEARVDLALHDRDRGGRDVRPRAPSRRRARRAAARRGAACCSRGRCARPRRRRRRRAENSRSSACAVADQARQRPADPPLGDQAAAREGGGEDGAVGGEAEVGEAHHREAEAGAGAVHGRDHGLPHREEIGVGPAKFGPMPASPGLASRFAPSPKPLPSPIAFKSREVRAGAEAAPRAGDHDRHHRWSASACATACFSSSVMRFVIAFSRSGRFEGDGRDRILDLVAKLLIHAVSSPGCASLARPTRKRSAQRAADPTLSSGAATA